MFDAKVAPPLDRAERFRSAYAASAAARVSASALCLG